MREKEKRACSTRSTCNARSKGFHNMHGPRSARHGKEQQDRAQDQEHAAHILTVHFHGVPVLVPDLLQVSLLAHVKWG